MENEENTSKNDSADKNLDGEGKIVDSTSNSADLEGSESSTGAVKSSSFEKTHLYESTSNISFNFDQLQLLLSSLTKYLKQTNNFNVEVTYSHRFLGKVIGDLPYLNHIHLKSSKLKKMLIKLRNKEFKIDLSDSIRCEIVDLEKPNKAIEIESVSMSSWAKSLLDELESRANRSNELRDLLERIIVLNQ
jgi:hypothetical protein